MFGLVSVGQRDGEGRTHGRFNRLRSGERLAQPGQPLRVGRAVGDVPVPRQEPLQRPRGKTGARSARCSAERVTISSIVGRRSASSAALLRPAQGRGGLRSSAVPFARARHSASSSRWCSSSFAFRVASAARCRLAGVLARPWLLTQSMIS